MMQRDLSFYHPYIFTGGIMLLAASMPLSPFLVTVAQIILVVNWFAGGHLKQKLHIVWHRKALFFFLLIFLVHLIWLFNTQDFAYALKDLKIKLPVLVLPLILGTGRRLKETELKMILLVFTAAVMAASFFSVYRLSTISYNPMAELREMSLFISHIRFSLLVNIAIFSLLYLLVTSSFQWHRTIRNSLWISLAWLLLFLFILQSFTGIIIFIITSVLFLMRFSYRFEKRYWYIRYPLLYGLSALVVLISGYTLWVILSFTTVPPITANLKELTPSGNTYEHYIMNRQIENGNYVWINICEKELEREWNRKSSLDYYGTDNKGHELRYTLIRYLTSLGLDKDSAGVAQLTETDIRNIESGMANHIYSNNKWLYPRIYQVIWEIDNYRKGGNPSGHSLAQRFEYWKTGFDIIRNNFWFGVGTGDVAAAFDKQYAENDSLLDPEWQLRAHNQFITFLISFGITGFLIVMFAMIAPFFIEERQSQILPFIFASVALLSMLTEDTLETQAGATFFAFFYALFIFSQKKYNSDNGDEPC
ncbi:MAG: O-antigen ligase family protein [Bacteroidales bacterium]